MVDMDDSPTPSCVIDDGLQTNMADNTHKLTFVTTSHEKTARDFERDLVRQSRGYHRQIEATTASIVRKPIVSKTEGTYHDMLREWDLFVSEYEGSKDPADLKAAKDFILFYSSGRRGRIDADGRLTVATTHTRWKQFMAAWSRLHHVSFSKSHQDTILNFIKGGEKEVSPDLSTRTRPTHNFTRDDFVVCVQQLWQNDWHDFLHERYRVGLHLLLLLHCNTSARRAEYEKELTYADISLAVVWLDSTTQPQIVMDFRRTKAKGLQNYEREQPQHMLYELVGLPFYCNAVAFFMAAALADDVLQDYHSWDEICAIPRPSHQKHLLIEYHPDRKAWPLFPRSSRRGHLECDRTSASLTSQALVDLGTRAGFRDNLVLHAARREVLLQVDNYGYSCNERMRFAAHTNEATYRRSYQTAMPLVDGQASYFGGEARNSELHALRRGYTWRRNPFHQPQLRESTRVAAEEAANSSDEDDSEAWTSSDPKERQRGYDQRRIHRDTLLRQQHLATPSLEGMLYESDFSQTRKLMPERDRLATSLFREGSLRDDIGRLIMDDLIRLCRSQSPLTNCWGLNPSISKCATCDKTRGAGDDPTWWLHVYQCRRRSAARDGGFAEFCFLCFVWYDDRATWQKHAHEHMLDLPLKCNMVVFRHNVVRPALCPACLREGTFRQFVNLTTWKSHLHNHLLRPSMRTYPHPRCKSRAGNKGGPALLNHLADVHHISFEKAKRQRVLRLATAAGQSGHSVAKEFSFVHVNSEQYKKGNADHGQNLDSKYASTATTAVGPPRILIADEKSILAVQDDDGSGLIVDDIEVCFEDDHVVTDHESCDAGPEKTQQTKKARTRRASRILVMVPPVPDSWKRGDIPRIDALDDDTEMSTVTEQSKPGEPPRRARGRPRGSRNRRVLRQERRSATLTKTRAASSKITSTP